jgi:KEOPS complex subunit Pcc1
MSKGSREHPQGERKVVKAARAEGQLEFRFGNERVAGAVFKAIKPERELPEPSRCKVSITLRKTVLCLRVEAQDTAALRAAVNSFVRLVKVAKDVIERCE